MKALLFKEVGSFSIDEISCPAPPEPNWITLRVKSAGLCGSDIHKLLFDRNAQYSKNAQILGHEVAGEVIESRNEIFTNGDRVVVNPLVSCGICDECKRGNHQHCYGLKVIGRDYPGGFAEFLHVPVKQLHRLDAEVSYAEGCLVDPLAAAIHCVNLLSVERHETLAVVGDGTLGLLCALAARHKGTKVIVVFGKHNERLAIADGLGATETVLIEESKHFSSFDRKFDAVIEAVGGRQSKTMEMCIRLIKPRGRVGVLGVFDNEFLGTLNFRLAFYKEAQLLGSNSYHETEFKLALELLKSNIVNVRKIISHELPLEAFERGLNIATGKNSSRGIKVIFYP